ncbi:MAG: gliding motility-associated C-terminal domain-containing protein [Flavobacteriales bacterium]|nr:gliding motility-associated C-terminal domain-containing protein [Flavobacteriales bacterium]
MFRSLLVAVFTFFILDSHAQKEATWWYFGNNAGISFTGTNLAPVAQTNGKMNNLEGVASISNTNGGLLFYTDGEFVFTKKHAQMTNGSGLKGHNSATQSAVIVQQPVRANRFYIFTVDENWSGHSNGFHYSIVDTSLNGGDGQVVSKNNFITAKPPEKVSAVKHANKVDTWIVSHDADNNDFLVYKLSSAGLSSSPVVSSVGPAWSSSNNGFSKGYMKFSPDGTKLVAAVAGNQNSFGGRYQNNQGRIEVYDFDNLTGKLSNPQIIDKSNVNSTVGAVSAIYGVEFSPNGRYVYFSFYIPAKWTNPNGDGNDGIWQMDLSSGIADTMGKSVTQIVPNSNLPFVSGSNGPSAGGMQLGPDGKIYIARYNRTYLSVIEKPNCKGLACSFKDNGIDLSGKRSQWGVPTFISSFFNKAEFDWGSDAANLCEKANTKFYVLDSTGIDSAVWDFGDPSTGSLNRGKGFTVFHEFSKAATYSVFVELFRKVSSADCYADTARKLVTIFPNPVVNIGRDTSVCEGEEVVMDANTTNATYVWHDNSVVPIGLANKKGWSWVDVKVGGCTTRDSLYLDIISYPKIDIGKDTLICEYDSIKLTGNGGDKYLWSTGDTTLTTFAKKAGMVWLRASNKQCFVYDTMILSHSTRPPLNLGRDSVMCVGDSITLQAKTQNSKLYFWSDNSKDSFLKVKKTGTYWGQIKDSLCFSLKDTVKLTFQSKFTLDLGKDTFFCKGGTFTLNATVAGAKKYVWHDLTGTPGHVAKTGGKKYVTVTNGTCSVSDTILLTEVTLQPFSLGPDTTLCNGTVYDIIPGALTDVEFTWMGTSVGYSYPISSTGKYFIDYVDLPKKVCKLSDTVKVTFKGPTAINLGRDTVLCIGQNVTLDVSKYGFKKIKWWDNTTSPNTKMNDFSITKHFVEGDDGVCKSSDTINISYRPDLAIDLGQDFVLCDNETYDFDITTANATIYEWLLDGVNVASTPNFTITNPGGKLKGRVSDGFCDKVDSVTVSYLTTPVVDIGPDVDVCDGNPASVKLDASASSASNYQWNTGELTPSIDVTNQGLYFVKASNGNCEASDSAWVYFSNTPDFSFGFDDSVFCDNPRLDYDFTSPNTRYTWSTGSTLPSIKITQPGLYTVRIENPCGIQDLSVNITIDEFGCRLIIPTAFSPNEDGINDVWRPSGQVLKWVEFVVYNRWGEIIHKGDPFVGWDGKVNGEYVSDGVYAVTISYRQSSNGYPRLFVKNMVLTVLK